MWKYLSRKQVSPLFKLMCTKPFLVKRSELLQLSFQLHSNGLAHLWAATGVMPRRPQVPYSLNA